MGATVRLLGSPRVDRDGEPGTAPRGNKVWALLACLVLGDRPPTRAHLVSLLFAEAADPLGALRWNTSELRRTLGGLATLGGDPLTLRFAEGCTVDVRVLLDGSAEDAAGLDTLGLELLEGVAVPTAPAFEAWLAAERARVAGCSENVLVERALDLLAAGAAGPAVRLAARAVAMDPLAPDAQAVLVRSLGAVGDHAGARRQAERCADLFRRELGCAAPAEVLAAVAEPPAGRQRAAVTAAAVHGFLEAGQASLTAGAVGRGLEQLDRAAATAVEVGEPALRAQAFVALAGARIHGTGERGTAVRGLLQEAAALARQAGAGELVAAACRELGFVAVQRGQLDRALVWLEEGRRATTDDAELARLLGVRGMCLSDGADHAGADEALTASARPRAAGRGRPAGGLVAVGARAGGRAPRPVHRGRRRPGPGAGHRDAAGLDRLPAVAGGVPGPRRRSAWATSARRATCSTRPGCSPPRPTTTAGWRPSPTARRRSRWPTAIPAPPGTGATRGWHRHRGTSGRTSACSRSPAAWPSRPRRRAPSR